MAENTFHQLQPQLEQVLPELKLSKGPERRRFLLREMSLLLAEGRHALEVPKRVSERDPDYVSKAMAENASGLEKGDDAEYGCRSSRGSNCSWPAWRHPQP